MYSSFFELLFNPFYDMLSTEILRHEERFLATGCVILLNVGG